VAQTSLHEITSVEEVRLLNEGIREEMKVTEDPVELERLLRRSREIILTVMGNKRLEKAAKEEYEKTRRLYEARIREVKSRK